MTPSALEGGFANPAIEAAQAFRAVMEAMARPGTVTLPQGAMPPAPVSAAAGAVILTLCDTDTPICLAGTIDTPDTRDWIAFHTGAPICPPEQAMFALGTWEDLLPLSNYPVGTADNPDRSATLIVEMPELATKGATLSGPGIAESACLSLPDIPAFQANHALFPCGLDFLLTCETRLAALPRSTEVR